MTVVMDWWNFADIANESYNTVNETFVVNERIAMSQYIIMTVSFGYNERGNKETLIRSTPKILPLDHKAWWELSLHHVCSHTHNSGT